jgi:hypothetical protein
MLLLPRTGEAGLDLPDSRPHINILDLTYIHTFHLMHVAHNIDIAEDNDTSNHLV